MSGIAGKSPERRLMVVNPNEIRKPIQNTHVAGRRPLPDAVSPCTISRGTWARGKARRSCEIHCRRRRRMRQSVAVKSASMYEPHPSAGARHSAHGTGDRPWK
jgi:hypothetical protein